MNRQPAIVERLVKDIGSMKDLRNVEVEIRVGLMSGEGFKSNVQKDDFYAFQKLIGKGRSFTMSEETDYIFEDHERGQNYRISYDEDNKRCIRAIAKRREGNHDMGTFHTLSALIIHYITNLSSALTQQAICLIILMPTRYQSHI